MRNPLPHVQKKTHRPAPWKGAQSQEMCDQPGNHPPPHQMAAGRHPTRAAGPARYPESVPDRPRTYTHSDGSTEVSDPDSGLPTREAPDPRTMANGLDCAPSPIR